jgi:hypothetical protein
MLYYFIHKFPIFLMQTCRRSCRPVAFIIKYPLLQATRPQTRARVLSQALYAHKGIMERCGLIVEHNIIRAGYAHYKITAGYAQQG